ncbi:hypothetical protein A2U01_0038240 [Trifolium medium]|uniref:Uncharacterized protein n=1 Tax=Trifolium medium TaxID=97028 RepID=A0A392PY88_9FABA|nr:hypothetical protein [Trifolium medium]
MAPVAGVHEAAKGLATLADLVDKIRILVQDILEGSKYSFENVVAQLKVSNPRVELNTEGIRMLRRVENGQIIIPEVYKDMEAKEEEEDDEQLDDDNHEEVYGEDGEHQDKSNDNNA